MAFKHSISFAKDLAANVGWNRFRITPVIVSKLLRAAIWSRCAVLFESEQMPFHRTGSQFRPAALYMIRFGTCCFVPMSYIYSETLIETLSKSYGRCFDRHWLSNNVSPIPSTFSFYMKKKGFVAARNLQSIRTLLMLEPSHYSKNGSMFSSSKKVAVSSDCSWLGNALCLCSPVWPAQAEQESAPKNLTINFAL